MNSRDLAYVLGAKRVDVMQDDVAIRLRFVVELQDGTKRHFSVNAGPNIVDDVSSRMAAFDAMDARLGP